MGLVPHAPRPTRGLLRALGFEASVDANLGLTLVLGSNLTSPSHEEFFHAYNRLTEAEQKAYDAEVMAGMDVESAKAEQAEKRTQRLNEKRRMKNKKTTTPTTTSTTTTTTTTKGTGSRATARSSATQ